MRNYSASRDRVFVSLWLALLCLIPVCANADIAPPSVFFGPALPAPATGPQIRVTLTRSIYRIHIDPKTGAPTMPTDVKAFAVPVNWPVGTPTPTAFNWRVLLNWDFAPFPTQHSIGDQLFTQPSPLKVNLKDQIRGGTLKVFARVQLNGKEIVGQAQALVLGENPTQEAILRAFPRNRFGLLASKIAVVESRMRQFSEGDERSPEGFPILSRSNDVGLMQLNPPSGGLTSADQVWDWRANLLRGLEMLAGKRDISFLASRHATGRGWIRGPDEGLLMLGFLNAARTVIGLQPLPEMTIPPLSKAPGSGVLPGETDPDKLSLSQLERESIRRYNGGREYAFVVIPDLTTLSVVKASWEIDPARGGVSPTSGDPAYVSRVLMAHSGLTLLPPPKPKAVAQKPRSVRRKKH